MSGSSCASRGSAKTTNSAEAKKNTRDEAVFLLANTFAGMPGSPPQANFFPFQVLQNSGFAFYRFTGMSDLPAAGPDGNQKWLKALPQILASQPGGVYQPEIVNSP